MHWKRKALLRHGTEVRTISKRWTRLVSIYSSQQHLLNFTKCFCVLLCFGARKQISLFFMKYDILLIEYLKHTMCVYLYSTGCLLSKKIYNL